MKRNTVVIGAVLFILATFAWAGWANYEYRKQEAEKRLASAAKGSLVAAEGVRAVKRLQNAYAHYQDQGLWADLADLCTDDVSAEFGLFWFEQSVL